MDNDATGLKSVVDSLNWPRGVRKPIRSVIRIESRHGRYSRNSGDAEAEVDALVIGPVCTGEGRGSTITEALCSAIKHYAARFGKEIDAAAVAKLFRRRRRR